MWPIRSRRTRLSVTSTPQRSQTTPLCLMRFMLAAGAFPVTCRPEDAFAKEASFFRFERPVVDCLRVLNFTLAPATYAIGGRHGDSHLVKADGALLSENFANVNFFHEKFLMLIALSRILYAAAPLKTGSFPPTRTSRPRPFISLMRTLKDSGVPASRELSPLTMDS